MQFGKKSDLRKLNTVLQFGHFGRVFSPLLGSLDKGGKPKVVPPLYVPPLPLQRWRRPPRESALGLHLALWRHMKNDDSIDVLADYGLLANYRRGLVGVYI